MRILEFIALAEVLIAVCAGVLFFIGWCIARNDPDDPLYLLLCTFWRSFRRSEGDAEEQPAEPVALKHDAACSHLDVSRLYSSGDDDNEEGPSRSWKPAPLGDEYYGRMRRAANGKVPQALVSVKVVPHASSDRVVGRYGSAFKIQVMAAPEHGKANKAVVTLLADALGLRPFQVMMLKGHYQARKVVRVTGMDQAEVDARLSGYG